MKQCNAAMIADGRNGSHYSPAENHQKIGCSLHPHGLGCAMHAPPRVLQSPYANRYSMVIRISLHYLWCGIPMVWCNFGSITIMVWYSLWYGTYSRIKTHSYVPPFQAFKQAHTTGCRTDSILYNTLLYVLWDTGLLWAQQKAVHLLRTAIQEGHVRKPVGVGSAKLELPLQGMSPGVAMLVVHSWLADLQ
jgi:hypothetical protein